MNTENLHWKNHSHITMSKYFLKTEVTEVDGKPYYKHIKTPRNSIGMPTGKSKVTFSKEL